MSKSTAYDATNVDQGKKVCFRCGEDDDRVPKLFEEHHIFGRSFGKETIPLCLNCHAKVTYYQNLLSPSVRKKSTNKLCKLVSCWNSVGAMEILMGERKIELSLALAKEMQRRGIIA